MLRDLWRFLWWGDSESACIIIINAAECLSDRDVKQMADYLRALSENREAAKGVTVVREVRTESR